MAAMCASGGLADVPLAAWVVIAQFAGADGVRGLAGTAAWVRAMAVAGWETTPGKLLGTQERWRMWGAEQAPSGAGANEARQAKRRKTGGTPVAAEGGLSTPAARRGPFVLWSPTHAGRHAVVASAYLGGRRVAVKVPYHSGGSVAKERQALGVCNALGVGPHMLAAPGAEEELVTEWVEGVVFVDFLSGATRSLKLWAVAALLGQCRALDAQGVVKSEMSHPGRHIIIARAGGAPAVRMIDFDRAVVGDAPTAKNVTQVCQYLSSARLVPLLGTNVALIRQRAKAYKQNPSAEAKDELMECFDPPAV